MAYLTAIDDLRRNKSSMIELSSSVSQERAAWKPDSDRWSLLEVINHLADIENEDFRTDFELVLFRPEAPWPSFNIHEWLVERQYNERRIGESIDRFEKEREKSLHWLRGLEVPDLGTMHSGNGFAHSPMSAGDVLVSWIAHDLFHIRQIALLRWDILNAFEKPYNPIYSGFSAV